MDLNIDFNALGKQAEAMINEGTTPPSGQPDGSVAAAPVVVPSGQPTTPTVPASTVPATPGQTVSPAQEKMFELSVSPGKVEKLTEAQIREAYFNGLRQQDYTKKTQELARQRQELEAQLQQLQQTQQSRTVLPATATPTQAPAAVPSQQPVVPNIDPAAQMTVGQGMQLAQAIAEQLQQIRQGQNPQQLQQSIAEVAQKIVENRLEVAKYAEQFNSALSEVYGEQPVLKVIPEIEDVLRFRVAQRQPGSIEDAKAALKTIAAEIAGTFSQHVAEQNKQQVIQKQQLVANGIEPPGGAVPQPQQDSYKTKDNKLDWNKLRDAALSQFGG